MQETGIHKNRQQLCCRLEQEIEKGAFLPGECLPSVRALAVRFHVSPVTVIKAMDLLEKSGKIVRHPGKGIFVSESLSASKRHLSFAFCFPPEKFDPDFIGGENWGLASEFYRGLLAGAAQADADISFCQFPYNWNEEDFERYRKQLAKYDLVIFVNDGLTELANRIGEIQLALTLRHTINKYKIEKNTLIDYDRKQAVSLCVKYAVEHGMKSAGAITSRKGLLYGKENASLFMSLCSEQGMETLPENFIVADTSELPVPEVRVLNLTELLEGKLLPDILYCDCVELLQAMDALLPRLKTASGKPCTLIDIRSGAYFGRLNHPWPYVRVPRFEMGFKTVEIAASAIREKRKIVLPLFPPTLISHTNRKEEVS